jgi:DNA-binding beta-propeller fold protein YncE
VPHRYRGKHRAGSVDHTPAPPPAPTPAEAPAEAPVAAPVLPDFADDLEFEPPPTPREYGTQRAPQPDARVRRAPAQAQPQPVARPARSPREAGRRPLTIPLVIGAAAALVVIVIAAIAVPALVRSSRSGGATGGFGGSSVVVKPAAGFITFTPADALISVDGGGPATGTVATAKLTAGAHTVTITRRGFKPLSATLTVVPGKPANAEYKLTPIPQSLSVSANPAKARITIVSGGKTIVRTGSVKTTLPAGPATITVTAAKHNTLVRSVFLDQATKLQLWMDPTGQVVHSLGVFTCVDAPKGVGVTPDGKQFWVTALVSKPSIEAYDVTGHVLGKVSMGGSGAVEVVFNKDGSKAYASQMQSASVFEIDTKTFTVLRQVKTGSSWTKMMCFSPDEKILYAANWSGDDVSEIDLASGKLLRRFPTVDTPRGMYPTSDGKRLFIAGFGEQSLTGRLAVIDLAAGKSKTFFTIKGGAMRHMVADEKRGVIFTSDMGKACVWVTDMQTLKTTKWAKTDSHPNTMDLSPDGKVLIVSCRGANNPKSYYVPGPEWGSILLFDTTTGKLLDAIIGGNQCTALDLSPDGHTLMFSDFLDARMHVYDIPSYETLKAGKGGRAVSHLADIRKPGWSSSGSSGSGGGD